jgi:Protein of unknwon function (DUF3310)
MSANDKKIKHYASEYQHWDLAAIIPLGYFEGCSTKYVTRWRKKDGLEDLDKAMHYLDKLMEFYPFRTAPPRKMPRSEIQYEVSRFAAANGLSIIEEEFILLMCNYRTDDDLRTARLILEDIIELAKEPNRPGTPEDGGHHAVGQTDS